MSRHIDPRHVAVETRLGRSWDPPESFQDIMAEQLRHAPWLAISILLHGLAVLILLSIPASVRRDQDPETVVMMETPEEPPADQEEPPEPPEDAVPPDPADPVIDRSEPVMANEVDERTTAEVEPMLDDLAGFDDALDTPIGIGPGDLGIRGGRRGGRGRAGPGGRPLAPSILSGLEWLRDHQDADGRWSSSAFMKHCPAHDLCDGPGNPVSDVGVTGLALLAFLGDGSTLRAGPFRKVVKRATIWLKDQQRDDGLIGAESGRQFMYSHAIASLALIEAYGLSTYRTLARYAQRSVDYVCKARNPYKVWRYYPHDGDNDTSVTGWMVFVLKSAKDFGLRVDEDALTYALGWFDEVTDPATGRCGYTSRGEGSSREVGMAERFPAAKTEAMTATGLLCRIFLGQTPRAYPVLATAADTMLQKPPVWNTEDGSIDLYYWYYATYAMFQLGGRYWKQWRKHLDTDLARHQRHGGHAGGSWDPVGVWGHAGGRVYTTAIAVLCLESYYRYSPLHR